MLGRSSAAKSLWVEALERADRIQVLTGLDEPVTADDWIDFDDELDFLIEEVEEDMPPLELRLATLLKENAGPVINAAKADRPLLETELFNWNWAANIALAINGDAMSRLALWEWKKDEPERLNQWLAQVGIDESELPLEIFDRPNGIVESEPGPESDRLHELARRAYRGIDED